MMATINRWSKYFEEEARLGISGNISRIVIALAPTIDAEGSPAHSDEAQEPCL